MIQVRGLTYQIAGKLILKDLTFQVEKGEMLAILGANGAGKTSLMRCLAGELQGQAGGVYYRKRIIKSYAIAELAKFRAYLHQQNNSSMAFLVEDIVRMGRYQQRSTNAEQEATIIREAMEICAVNHLASRSIQALSGGEQQRVHLARVLAQIWDQREAILLLDEPIANMDMQFQHQSLAIAAALAKAGFTVVAVLHELNLAAQYASRIMLLKAGRKWADGSPCEVLTPTNIYAVFGVNTEVEISRKTLVPQIGAPAISLPLASFNSFL
ncbi:heme ABC transporter ATP-binding protein [Sphingobacteriaceae bacterium WQ 2009]|uniref:Heme ABC transporter ATP-binding protein n=1 Tax=Rhinopithecimicrobium faecis TaxID=2820698 RepID=A0A8T4H6X5_9SPHI|nr:heme ABC transporter ATP-binding protein [Sphingobacteriaceae bacterium WQ 2009]